MKSFLTILLFAVAPVLSVAEDALLPPLVTSTEMQEPRHHDNPVRVRGTVRDVFPDELNPNYAFLVILSETGPVYAAVKLDAQPLSKLRKLVNATVEATGICRPSFAQLLLGRQPRLYMGRILELKGSNCLRVLTPAPADPFCVPEIATVHNLYPYQLQQIGLRKASGRVLAAWSENRILIETREGSMMRVELADGPLPASGDFIETVGYPDTDIFRINFTRALWRPVKGWPVETDPVRTTTAAAILTDGHGTTKVDISLYGKPIRLTGIVRTLPAGRSGQAVFLLDNGGFSVPVDVSACRDLLNALDIDAVIRATGICVLNIENWRPNAIFPQTDGFTLVVRRAADVEVVSFPSWWTARRLGWLLAFLLTALAVILVWNRALGILAERRGKQLAKEQVRRATSELKVQERTRFSADLHDALSQTLSGIAMQLGAIKRFATTDPTRMAKHLDIATRTLKSCRDEMRNLIWDLRSEVLDEPDLETAVRHILEPHLEGTEMRIRFAIPRSRLSDMTTRTLFCIVRELAVNAIRHGHASVIRIAGSVENGRLLCSVGDNGSGFDPQSSPGPDEGHFGLQGIRERMEAVDGDLVIESTPGKGTKVTVSMSAPHDIDEESRTT